jgi:hypothetical protein
MSIRREWLALVDAGQLARLLPLAGDPSARTVLLSREVRELLEVDLEEGEKANRRSRLLATLHNIVAGRRLVVCMTPFNAHVAIIGRLDPVEDAIWDIRCQEKPALRVFCRFVERDVLFAATCRPRSIKVDWLGWLPLGDRNSKEWRLGMEATKKEWAKFFPAYSPVRGESLDVYLSNATLEGNRRGA